MKPIIYYLSYQNDFSQLKKNELLQYGFQHYFGFPYLEADIFIAKNGKPELFPSRFPDQYFNLSHSKHYMALCCSNTAVGIDLEEPRKFSAHLLNRISSSSELKIIDSYPNQEKIGLLLWTLKEAYIKYLGVGLTFPLADMPVPLENDLNLDCDYLILSNETLTTKPLFFHCFQFVDYRITLCSETNQRPELITIKKER